MKSVAYCLPLLVACYGAAPPKPARIPLPPVVEGAELSVHTEERTTIESVQKEASTCPAGHAPGSQACTVTRYSVKEPVTRTHSTVSYADQPISYAQFQVMTDPQYDQKLSRLEALSHTCKRANVPRYVGMGLMLGSLIAAPIVGKATDSTGASQGTLWGMLGVGGASFALGYFSFGGRDCNEARGIYNDVNVAGDLNTHTVTGGGIAVEMQELAARFNANQSQSSAMRMR
ncbi:MAG TPA: hypothetical protein VIV11_17125 [Kofleriaceae bacterium]